MKLKIITLLIFLASQIFSQDNTEQIIETKKYLEIIESELPNYEVKVVEDNDDTKHPGYWFKTTYYFTENTVHRIEFYMKGFAGEDYHSTSQYTFSEGKLIYLHTKTTSYENDGKEVTYSDSETRVFFDREGMIAEAYIRTSFDYNMKCELLKFERDYEVFNRKKKYSKQYNSEANELLKAFSAKK